MTEITTKASPVLLYGSLILALVFFLAASALAYINRGSDEVFQIVRPMVLAIFLAFAYLASIVFLGPPATQEAKVQVMLYRKHDRALIPLGNAVRELRHVASQMFLLQSFRGWESAVRASGHEELLSTSGDLRVEAELFLDILEVAFFEWLRFEYASHWDVVPVGSHGLSSAIRKNQKRPGAADRVSAIGVEAMEAVLSQNEVVKSGAGFGKRMDPESVRELHRRRLWVVPEGSKLSVKRSPMSRSIRLAGRYSDLQIELRHLWNLQTIGGTELSNRLADSLKLSAQDREQAIGHVYEVSFVHERPRLYRWAPEAIRQAQWATDMAKRFAEDFGWEGILEDLQKHQRSRADWLQRIGSAIRAFGLTRS